MKLWKLLLTIPVLTFALCLTGCTDSSGTTVIEADQMTDEEITKADEDYDAQYAEEAENYE